MNSGKNRDKIANLKPFKPGHSGNPAGRPKGSRNKLSAEFIAAMCADFEEHGADVIAKVRQEKPEAYLRVIASIVPRQVEVGEAGTFSDMTGQELDAFIAEANAKLGYIKGGKGAH